jgi:hypothetical protein
MWQQPCRPVEPVVGERHFVAVGHSECKPSGFDTKPSPQIATSSWGLFRDFIRLESVGAKSCVMSLFPTMTMAPEKERLKAVTEQVVDAEGLLSVLWTEGSRPSLSWLRKATRARALPFIKVGRRIWYRPSEVLTWLDGKYTHRPKPMTSGR